MEMEDGQTFVGQRNFAGRKWIAGIDQRYPLEVDDSARELRHDEIHVFRQAAQERTGDLLRAIATLIGVALELLDPFQVDDRRDADQQIRVRGNIDLITDERTMQAFIKQ